MPKCRKCGSIFSSSMLIDGKRRNLFNRRVCLDCLPFKSPYRIDRIVSPDNGIPVVCSVCGRCYMYFKNRRAGHTKTKCNSCMANIRRWSIKNKMLLYKGSKCSVCGYSKCLSALEFHHTDSKEKNFGLSGFHCLVWSRIKEELDKCVLLCSNCHRELHQKIRDEEV